MSGAKHISTPRPHTRAPLLPTHVQICFRGCNVFVGYYKDDEKTREAFDENGWLMSGDIGMWNLDGALKIIGACACRDKLFRLLV